MHWSVCDAALTGCDPEAAVCLHTATGEWQTIGMAPTQQIIGTSEQNEFFSFVTSYKFFSLKSIQSIPMYGIIIYYTLLPILRIFIQSVGCNKEYF